MREVPDHGAIDLLNAEDGWEWSPFGIGARLAAASIVDEVVFRRSWLALPLRPARMIPGE